MIGWLYFFLALLITVFIHELGHMLIALLCRVKVLAFSLGFGKVLLHKQLWNIDFRLSLFPLGGYCKLDEDLKTGWLTKKYSKKLFIILAGVTANLLLAFLCYYLNYKSIKLGLYIDLKLIQGIFTKDYDSIYRIVSIVPNLFLLQLGMLNLFSCLSNLLPIPALDGGYIWLLLLEKKVKNFPKFLDKITKVGFIVLTIVQFLLIYYLWFM